MIFRNLRRPNANCPAARVGLPAAAALLLAVPLVFFLCRSVSAQFFSPLRLQDISDQAIGGIDTHIPPARQLCVIARAFYLLETQCVGFGKTRFHFVLHREGDVQCQRLDQLQQQITYRAIHRIAWYALAYFGASPN